MAESEVKILTVDAVQSMADLRKAISDTKEALNGMELGSEEYQRTLSELIKEQNLMRGAMNGTTASMDDLKAAADGTTVSYNGLVNSMANMKRELRNLDLSTAEGRARFKELSQEIKNTNDALKELDEKQGSYVRNVGNYTSGLKNLGDILKNNVPTLGRTAQAVGDVDKAVHLLGQQPVLGIIGLLAPLLTKIAMSLKEDEGAMAAVKKIMDAMKPVMDFFSGLLEQIVDVLGDIIGKLGEFLGSSGFFQKLVQGVIGVGNAILQYVIAPFKGVIAAIKVLKEQGVKGLGDAARAFTDEMAHGFAFKENFKAGQAVADAVIAGAKSKKPGREIAQAVKQDMEDEFSAEEMAKMWERAMAKYNERKGRKDALSSEMQGVLDEQQALIDAEVEQYIAALEDEAAAEKIVRETEVKMAKEAAKQKLDSMATYASGASGLLNGVADMLEAEGQSAKNLRIAAATIDMISGAVTAFSTAQQLGPIAGPIVGAINAAAVVASGLANIAKIRATNVSKDAAPTSSAPAQATVSAPALETAVPTTTVINGARTETALNRASQPSRVYVVQSDIEAAAQDTRVQVAESSF
mgnify:FL=1